MTFFRNKDKKVNSGVYLWEKAKKLIPGGSQLLSKRSEMFLPNEWPAYYSKAKGSRVWDIDGNEYTDMTISGVGCCILGFSDPDVDKAVIKAIKKGNMATLNVPEEVELAELLCKIHPWANMVRYARTGGEAMSIAVRIIRAATGKEKIVFCGYHGWHDWYLSANLNKMSALDKQLLPGLEPAGVPTGLKDTLFPFYYNDLGSFKVLIDKYDREIAGVVMEPIRNYWPQEGFLEEIRKITIKENIPLVFDEITSGLRMTNGGIHLKLGIEPDIAVFAKSLSNGYPMAAVIGRSKIMNAAQKTFISSTYWTDRIGPVAALATLKKYKNFDVSKHLILIGNLIQDGWRNLARKYELDINVIGIPPLSHWKIKIKNSRLLHTIIVKKMLEKGFLTSNNFYAMYSHSRKNVDEYLDALDEVLGELTPLIKKDGIKKIKCSIAHKGFERLN